MVRKKDLEEDVVVLRMVKGQGLFLRPRGPWPWTRGQGRKGRARAKMLGPVLALVLALTQDLHIESANLNDFTRDSRAKTYYK